MTAASASGGVITMLKDRQEGGIVLPEGVTLDLNGFRLTCTGLNATAAKVIDSQAGTGMLLASSSRFNAGNPQLPLWDKQNSAYRFYSYTFTVQSESTEAGEDTRNFWFRLEFASDSAYRLIQSGYAGMRIGVELLWNDRSIQAATFGATSADTFCKQWGQAMLDDPGTWLYAGVTGVDTCPYEGTVAVRPWIKANGVSLTVTGDTPTGSYTIIK